MAKKKKQVEFVESEIAQTRESRRDYRTIIGDKKYNYYMKRFNKMEVKHKKVSFNLSALVVGPIWCFHRRLFGPALVALLLHGAVIMTVIYTNVIENNFMNILLSSLIYLPNVYFAFFGNYHYLQLVKKNVHQLSKLSGLYRESFIKENAGGSYRLSAPVAFVYIIFLLTFTFNQLVVNAPVV